MSHFIQWHELVDPFDFQKAPNEHKANITQGYYRLCQLRHYYGKPLVCRTFDHPNRGYRTLEKHFSLYKKLGKQPPLRSLHLVGAAYDIHDPNQDFQKWILDHLEIAESMDIYFEDFESTPTWVHWQLYAPSSGKRFFKP